MDGWIQLGDGEKIPVEDVRITPTEPKDQIRQHFDYLYRKLQKEYIVAQIRANGDHTCKKCKNLISILQEVNGEIMHCGYNCKKSSMRADDIKETRRCMLYARIDTNQ